MTSLLNALNSFSFTSTKSDAPADELEFQSVFAATAILLAGGTAAILMGLSQAL